MCNYIQKRGEAKDIPAMSTICLSVPADVNQGHKENCRSKPKAESAAKRPKPQQKAAE